MENSLEYVVEISGENFSRADDFYSQLEETNTGLFLLGDLYLVALPQKKRGFFEDGSVKPDEKDISALSNIFCRSEDKIKSFFDNSKLRDFYGTVQIESRELGENRIKDIFEKGYTCLPDEIIDNYVLDR